MPATTTGMETLTTAFSWITGQFSNMVDVITGEPLLLLSTAIFAVGGVIGLSRRLING